jgi:hypothetical protein
MRLGDHEGNFLIDTGANRSSVDAGLYGVALGSTLEISSSSLPTVESGTFDALDLSLQTPFAPVGGLAGIIGTDILGSRTVEFHYEAASPYLVLSTQRCSPRTFEDAGFVAIQQQGFGAKETWLSWFMSRFTGRTRSVRQVNLPIVHARIGTVSAQLWLDSGWGYGTSRRMTVHVNNAILSRLRAAGIAMRRTGSVVNFDCQGDHAEDEMWQVDSEPLVFATEDGKQLFEYGPPTLQLRGSSPCGTVGNWSEPIGAVGTLFLPRWGIVVFDGPNQRVWVPREGTITSPHEAFRSMAFSRGDNGGWSLSIGETFEGAQADSLRSCNERQTSCQLETTIGPSRFGCLAVAKKPNVGLPHPSSGSTIAAARAAALYACTTFQDTGCELAYSGCND